VRLVVKCSVSYAGTREFNSLPHYQKKGDIMGYFLLLWFTVSIIAGIILGKLFEAGKGKDDKS
jgi:hypothetical protein